MKIVQNVYVSLIPLSLCTGAEKKSNICLFKYVQKVNYYCKYSVNKPVFVAVCTDNKQNCATVEPQTKTDCVK